MNTTSINKLLLALLMSLAACGLARAEKADSAKPTVIDADEGSGSNVTQNRTLTGNVVLVKGTLVMKSGRALVVEDPQGYQFVTFWADAGKLATFRQKRDGGPDLWMEGEAERIEYNNKDEIVKLFSKAKVTQLDGKRTTDQAQGPFISYDSRTEVFNLRNTSNGDSTPGGGRVRMVIESKEAAKAAAGTPAAAPGTTPAKPGAATPGTTPVTAPGTTAPAVKPTTAPTTTPAASDSAASTGKQ